MLTLCASLEQVSDASVQAACMLILKTTRLRLVRFIDSIRCFDSLLRFMDSIHGFDSLIRFVDSITFYTFSTFDENFKHNITFKGLKQVALLMRILVVF